MDGDHDIILPYWWLQLHEPDGLFSKDPKDTKFQSAYCRENCTRLKTQDKTKTATIVVTTERKGTIESVPERFRPFLPPDLKEATDKSPDRKRGATRTP